MQIGAITGYIDVAQVVLYVFWVFFAGLIFYLRREDRREGYPLERDQSGLVSSPNFVFYPDPKTRILPHDHGTYTVPNDVRDNARAFKMKRTHPAAGSPYEPSGDPMLAEVGPGSYALRADVPDLMHDGSPKIVPMKSAKGFFIAREDRDPRGLRVVGIDNEVAGTISEVWVDQTEQMIRYLEVALKDSSQHVLLPINFAKIWRDHIFVEALQSHHFANVPKLRTPGQITLLEEEKVMAYFGAGMLYGTPVRAEPIL
jgi:photosynthetic reaction center H subunit